VDQILDSSNLGELHFVVIDTEGSEDDVLAGFDLRRWRPWVLVVEATVPNSNQPSHGSWEPRVLDSGYEFCLFDGLSRFYVADEHAADLKERMSFPANVLDTYVRYRDLETRTLATTLSDEVIRWRSAALTRWADAVDSTMGSESDRTIITSLRKELERTHETVSWRVTSPLRTIRKRLP
jgi:Methyltransferase FkbM domain